MRLELRGLKAGPKQKWLRLHRSEVERYYFRYGPELTMAEFNLKQDTLERFLKRKGDDERITRLSENDKWVLRIANEGLRDVKRRLLVVEEFIEDATPVIELGRSIIKVAVGSIETKVGKTPLLKDNLSLANFSGELKK